MQLEILGVLEDGGLRGAAVPTNPRRTLRMPLGASLTLNARVVRANGSPVTGGTLTWTVKKKPSDTQPSFQKLATCADPTVFTVTPADTKQLTAGVFVFDVWHTDGSGNRNAVVPLSPFLIEPAATPPP